MGLRPYRTKRHFDRTPEPKGSAGRKQGNLYVIHKHAASRLHYDLRLQLEHTLKSWAVPKGPSLDPSEKRLAVHVEDHPLAYGKFEGTIPKGEYGAGSVILWDRGRWRPKGDPAADYRKGRMKFTLEGEKLRGGFNLVRMGGKAGEDGKNWLLIKERDAEAKPGSGDALLQERPESVLSGRTVEEMSPQAARSARAQAGRKAGKPKGGGRKIAPPPEAPKQKLPRAVAVELATPVEEAPAGDEWLHEIKFDGYRAICRIRDGRAEFLTRRGHDWSGRLRTLAASAAALPVEEALLDGEIVKVTPEGRTSFQALQNSFAGEDAGGVSYFAFDLMHLDGRALAPLPLAARKQALRQLLEAAGAESERIGYSDHVVGRGPEFFAEACRRGLEGIVSKRQDSAYRPGRGRDWLKIKCFQRQEFIIGGFTEPEGSREGIGALLLGVHDSGGRLVYCGRVGTGFTGAVLRDLQSRLARLERKEPPFARPPRGSRARGVHWVKPVLAAEVKFSEWTKDGLLRQPSFQGLREDKKTEEIVRERALPVSAIPASEKRTEPSAGRAANASAKERAASPAASRAAKMKISGASRAGRAATAGGARVEVAGVTLTHPEKVLYPDAGISKQELAEYYEAIAGHVLPHVTGRPLTLVRCPEGTLKPCFYQKHAAGETLPAAVRRVMIQEKKGRGAYLVIDTLEGLIGLVQRGVLEFHTWGSRADRLENPDRITFDLDPGPGVDWDAVLDAARLVRRRLSDRGLASFPKTTGGKGLHIVVPLRGRNDWDEVHEFSRALAEAVVREQPARFTATMSKAKRAGKIFLDYLRNVRGASAIAAYSTRARPGAPVSAPVRWEELTPALRSDSFTLRNLPGRLRKIRTDPWKDYEASRGAITAAARRGL
ncbi:MAG TPA: DNA ligase D [Candidatus Polarisedimenticolia bacterium]|jgi:bifunctional non-homologous end joining protein LigD|nr:DNA ligase D [Candidatus Polarisedimenticolia bacterium]